MSEDKKKTVDEIKQQLKGASINWSFAKMQTAYANVVNVALTREEISIFFGINQTWHIEADKEILVKLTDRVLLNPYAAKRLFVLLSHVIEEYESRFGVLDLGEKSHTIH